MGKILIPGSFGGGVTSDDVTASKAQVLQGYRTVTTDSDDEVIEGEIVNRGTFVIASEMVNAPGESTVHVRFEEGYYNKDGQYKPTAKIPYAVLPNVLGIDANKMLESLTIAGTRGTIPARGYHGPNGIEFWLYPQEGGFVVRLEEGFYSKDAGSGLKPYVIVPTDMVKNGIGYNPDKTLNDTEICGVRGNIPIRGNVVNTAEFVDAHWEQSLLARFEFGYYVQNGQWKPTIKIPYSTAASVLGVDANKMLKSLKIAGVQGNLDDRGSYVTASGIWYFGADNYLVAQIPPGLYGGGNGNGKTNVNILRQDLINALGLNPDMWLDSFQTMGIQGKIPRWICTTGDVISAVNGEGFAWDDTYAGRGRGIVVKIANGHVLAGANYVFLPSLNLYPQNVVKGININGVTGTRDFTDKVNDYTVAANLEISMSNREQVISLGNAYSGSETVFFGVDLVGEDVYDGFVRRDKGNGHYLIGRIPVSKSDSNLIGTYIRNVPVQIEIIRDGAGNISLVHHGPNQVLGATKLNIYIYAHSSISFRF